jgi:uncharacterized SAM-binding protein YcdF (DUF218 family)
MSFFLSKILWVFLSPGFLLALLLGTGLTLALSPRAALKKIGQSLCFLAAFCFILIAVLPVGDWALTPLENRFAFHPPDHVDGIVVLGGDEQTEISEARGQSVALDSMRRYAEFAKLARRYPQAKLVFSGGSGVLFPNKHVLASDVAQAIIADMDVPIDRMIFEKESRNTYENAVFSANLVHPGASQKWILVTSAWHMPRAMSVFRKAGWNVYAAPVGYFTTGAYRTYPLFCFDEQMHSLTLAVHEYVGLISYRLMGRTSALWPE